jgi:CelD/BcsL family acetyltransferase involved in cellulose biosynthesis
MPLPMLELSGLTYEEWFASKSAHFRQRARQVHRALVERGGQVRLADGEEDFERGLQEFARLHHASWRSRGGSGVLTPGVERMLSDAARELAVEGRFRLWLVEMDGRVIGAGVRLAAGGEVSNWLASFDEARRDINGPLLMMVAEIEDGLARGDRRIDLGGGRAELKSRVADNEQALETFLMLPPGARRPFVAASLLPGRLRRAVGARLPPRAKTALKPVLRR